tara:strand:- start:310 stop:1866 length:1557 start_codon:yes stop_codon:yes gene_type:complete
MAKRPTVTTLTAGYASNTQLNANFVALRDAFDNTVSRDGSAPNTLTADLDLNSNDILNANAIGAQSLTLGNSNFNLSALNGLGSTAAGFLSPSSSNPSTRTDGSALQAGDIYFNTSSNTPFVYSGTAWVALVSTQATVSIDLFSGNGSTTSFTLATAPASENFTFVYVAGVYIQKSAYSTSGTTLAFGSAPASGTNNIEVVTYSGQLLASSNNFSSIAVTGGTISGASVTSPALIGSKANGQTLALTATASGTPTNFLSFTDTGGTTANLGFTGASDDNLAIANETSAGALILETNSTERLRVDHTGKVGIAKNNPAYALDVTGDINLTGTLRVNGSAFSNSSAGSVIEELHSLCNTTSLKSRATIENVTGAQALTTSYADATGSKVSAYTCPAGTSDIVYELNVLVAGKDSIPMTNWRLYSSTDGSSFTEVTKARTNCSTGTSGADKVILRWVFKVNASSNDSTVGQFSAATPTLYFKWQARNYQASQEGKLHETLYFDGGFSNEFSLPSICVKAIA